MCNDGPGNPPPPLNAAGQSVNVAGRIGTWNGGQWPGLQRRGTGNVMGWHNRRPDAGYGRPQARHQTQQVIDW